MAILRTSWNSHQNNWCVNAFVPGGMVPFLPLDHTGPHGGAMPDQKAYCSSLRGRPCRTKAGALRRESVRGSGKGIQGLVVIAIDDEQDLTISQGGLRSLLPPDEREDSWHDNGCTEQGENDKDDRGQSEPGEDRERRQHEGGEPGGGHET